MPYDANKELLLNSGLSESAIQTLLAPVGFTDPQAAYRCLQRIARHPQVRLALTECLPQLLVKLSSAAGPDGVLISLERFVDRLDDPAAFFQHLVADPRDIDILVTLFASSQFLTEILLRHPEYFNRFGGARHLAQVFTNRQFFEQALQALQSVGDYQAQLDALRRFQRWELLRIGTCDLLDQFDLAAVTGQLSALADGLTRACLAVAAQQTGLSLDPNAPPEGFAVIAMGKLGGRELNYSSDIDLLFVANSDQDQYRRLGEQLIDTLASATDEGFLYRVDMRLRPWGRVGALVSTVEGYMTYLKQQARLWEKQALLKARQIAGDPATGEDFLRRANTFILGANPETIRSEVFAMKQRTEAYLRQQGREWGEVKLGEGSIRDIEFVIQFLQLAYGAKQPEIRSRNSLEALRRLNRYGLLSNEESRVLTDGYIFLRTVEHYLQMMHYRQTYTLPNEPAALLNLSRRLGFQGSEAGELFRTRYQQHSAAIRNIYLKYLGGLEEKASQPGEIDAPQIDLHLKRMDPSYQNAFSRQDIARHAALAEQLNKQNLVHVEADTLEDGRWRVTIVAYDYPGELSLICGLMFACGIDIDDGHVFTYEPLAPAAEPRDRRKIVDVFTVRPSADLSPEFWPDYANDLAGLLSLMQAGQRQEARIRLAKRAALTLPWLEGSAAPLYPIDIEIDNDLSPHYTVLHISAPDTIGFLYELTNALALNKIYIARVAIDTSGKRVHDILFVTDADGNKIQAANSLRELRAATVLIKHFTHLLPYSPDPEAALLHFHEFISQLFRHPDWPDEVASLERPEVLNALAQLLGVSEFLWEDFLRMQHANLFPVVRDLDTLDSAKSRSDLQYQLENELKAVHNGPQAPREDAAWRTTLNAFKDREMFRIDMRHILGHSREFWEFSEELTDLTEVIVNSAYHLSAEDLRSVYGAPLLENGQPALMSVCALGKCGGRELGFASDIELMFIYNGNGQTDGAERISSAEFYEKVVEGFMNAIHARREGIFHVDLQLRPYGKAGSLAVPVAAFQRYFAPEGPAWPYERQALIRLRPIAGDPSLGEQICQLRDTFVYTGESFDVTAMRAMRERQIRHLVKGGTFHPKYSPGGLVDIEYLVQGLQITHGSSNPALRSPNTRLAMAALAEAGILSPDDHTHLRKAHTFLRWLIDAQRVVAGNAKDLVVPQPDSEEFAYLARRLRYGGSTSLLREELQRYTADVVEINRRLLGK
jgi:glutamate-ammonia-ligase adenylyltransferase